MKNRDDGEVPTRYNQKEEGKEKHAKWNRA